jgi:hypothetical protein
MFSSQSFENCLRILRRLIDHNLLFVDKPLLLELLAENDND